jgi:hypothetical protein
MSTDKPVTRFDPRGRRNRALLVGVSEYDFAGMPRGVSGDLPAVKHNVNRLREALRGGEVFRERQIVVERSPSRDEFERSLRKAVAKARGVLLLYFAGHGALPSAGDELYLQMRDAGVIPGRQALFEGAAPFSEVLDELAKSRARQIVVVLDCCFAGNAAWIWEKLPRKRNVLLLMSVQANHLIDAGPGDTPTPFTEELVRSLERDGALGFAGLADDVRARMTARGLHTLRKPPEPWEPQRRGEPDQDVLLSARGQPHRHCPLARLGAAVRDLPGPRLVLRAEPDDRDPHARRRPRRVVATGLLTLLVLALGLGLGVHGLVAALRPPACAPPTELRVLTDPDLERTVRAAADEFLTSDENRDGDCRRSGITVYGAGAADTVTALRKHTGAWQEPRHEGPNPQRDIGPQPDVWIPASPADAARVAAGQDTDAVAAVEADQTPFAYSPVVLAVPEDLSAQSWNDRTGAPLARMIAQLKARRPDARIWRPDPEFTAAGLLATIGLQRSATGGDRDPAQAERDLVPGVPAPTAAGLLCTLPDDDAADDAGAALVPEFLMRSGVGCDAERRVPRTAQYPGDVPGYEPVFVRVRWHGGDRDASARDDAADRFRAWLNDGGGRSAFARDGFRAATGHRPLLDADHVAEGVLPAPSRLVESAGRRAMDTALERYRGANGPGRVLFLLDSSGSMGDVWKGPSGGPGLLKQSLVGLGPADEYGVWGVSGLGERSYEMLLAFGSRARNDAERTIDERARVRDAQADPHAALIDALQFMNDRGAADDRPQLIVYITDDEDANRLTGGNLDDVLATARAVKVPVAMVSLTSGGCASDKPDAQISAASGGRCVDADDDVGAVLHDEVARTGTGEE